MKKRKRRPVSEEACQAVWQFLAQGGLQAVWWISYQTRLTEPTVRLALKVLQRRHLVELRSTKKQVMAELLVYRTQTDYWWCVRCPLLQRLK